MDLISSLKIGVTKVWIPPISNSSSLLRPPRSHAPYNFKFPNNNYLTVHAKKKTVLEPNLVEEILMEEEDEEEELRFQHFEDDDEGEYFEDDSQVYVSWGWRWRRWNSPCWKMFVYPLMVTSKYMHLRHCPIPPFKCALRRCQIIRSFNKRIESGSPSIEDIEAFTASYRAKLEEAEIVKSITENISVEVSSPGVERVVRIPQELDRFKDRAMYVKYVSELATAGSSTESDGVFKIISFDTQTKCCTWGLADVRINREKAGKGRPLSKKQREWRLNTTFDSLHLVRLYSDY
ncbi:hypothetical protein EZV62_022511 [Acer yangbiense]|uniref:DUF7912 domain-containing protein n=1 Tax=Acer yangbiense TaxID=1000413 RepID=A0A5C7H9W7_9ROSI|nr:hypothetical protein EZV62_022511 [Acer yangbiense]